MGSRGRGKGGSYEDRADAGSKGKGKTRRSAPAGAAFSSAQKVATSHAEVANQRTAPTQRNTNALPKDKELSEEELVKQVKEAESEEISQRANECRLRQEVNQAQDVRDRVKRAETRARDAAEDSQRRGELNIESLRNELADLMKKVADYERSQSDQESKQKMWQAELDAMILSQASAMARRDELVASVARLEEQARTTEALATKEEAKVKYLENKLRKEKERLDVVRAQADALRREADDELAIKEKVQQEILQCQEEADLSLSVWRHLAAALGVAVLVALIFRAF